MPLPGLISSDKKKTFALQLAGGQADDNELKSEPVGNLPTDPFVGRIQAATQSAPVGAVADEAAAMKDFGFNPTYAAKDQELKRKVSDAALRRRQGLQDVNDTYQQTASEADRQKAEALQRLTERMASQGLTYSGINLSEQANTTNDFQRYLDQLNQSKARTIRDIESGYAGDINSVAAAREAMYMQQVQEEEAARLQDEQKRAQAEAARQEADRQAELVAALIAAQQAQPVPSFEMPSVNVSGIGVDIPGVGGGGSVAPQAEERIVLPFLNATSGKVTPQAVQGWVKQNIDPNLQGPQLQAVINAMSKAPQGLTRTELAQIIKNSQPVQGAYNLGGAIMRALK